MHALFFLETPWRGFRTRSSRDLEKKRMSNRAGLKEAKKHEMRRSLVKYGRSKVDALKAFNENPGRVHSEEETWRNNKLSTSCLSA